MKTSFVLALSLCCAVANAINWKDAGAWPNPAKYESFEDGVPKTWSLQGKGKLSINQWHYKLGKKSLQWDFKAGDLIKVNNTIGDPRRRGLMNNACYACFGVWIYSFEPMPDKKLSIEFHIGDKKTSKTLEIPLNFKGWQNSIKAFQILGVSSDQVSNVVIKAPKDSDGQILIDLMVYNSPVYALGINKVVRSTPFIPPQPNYKKFPIPEKLSDDDKTALERISKTLPRINIVDKSREDGRYTYDKAMKLFKALNIVDDEHSIRGKGILIPEISVTQMFYTFVGIPLEEVGSFRRDIEVGSRDKHYNDGLMTQMTNSATAGITAEQLESFNKSYALLWKFLIDQGFNTYSGNNRGRGYFVSSAYLFRKALFNAGLMKEVFEYSQYIGSHGIQPLYGPASDRIPINMDHFSYMPKKLFHLVFMCSDDPKKQVQSLHEVKARLDAEILAERANGWKPDGSGFHHAHPNLSYQHQAIHAICKIAYLMSHSSFALSDAAFNRLKKVVLSMYFFSNNCEVPIFMQGTYANSRAYYRGSSMFKVRTLLDCLRLLALASKNGCDEELAQAYVNLKDNIGKPGIIGKTEYEASFEKKHGIKPSALPQGTMSMPYWQLVAHRRGDWVAVTKSGGIDMRDRGNQYGYHMGNGPLSIMGKGGFHAGGTEEFGWDWNRTSGATVLYMPDLISMKFIHSGRPKPKNYQYSPPAWFDPKTRTPATKDDPVIKRGNGGITWRGVNGCARTLFFGDRLYNNFGAIKSYFFINDRIYALGSNIVSDNKKYHVQTNLYQKALYKVKVIPTATNYGSKVEIAKCTDTPTYVDNREIKIFPVPDTELAKSKSHHLIDTVGNGYYIAPGQDVFVARKEQKSRNTKNKKHFDSTGEFASAWLDHGIGCKDAKYCYVVFPYCNRKKFAGFSGRDFEILRQDSFAHIIHDKIDGFYAGIFFRGGNVRKLPHVVNVERDCQIMYKENNGKLEIAVGDPDPHRNWMPSAQRLTFGAYGGASELTPLKVAFSGSWKLKSPVDGVKIIRSGNNKTVIEFDCIHGKTFNFTLVGQEKI